MPGGVAQTDGRLVPGDRLMFVNDQDVQHATLDEAVQALKGAPKGPVRIGVVKALPVADASESDTDETVRDCFLMPCANCFYLFLNKLEESSYLVINIVKC